MNGVHDEHGRTPRQLSGLQLVIWPCVIVFLLQIMLGGGFSALNNQGGLFGILSLQPRAVWAAGSLGSRGLVENGEWWRLACPMFLHFSVLHLVMNMLCLVSLGRVVEQIWGRSGLVLTFLVTGLGGVILPLAWNLYSGERQNMAGASGAVCGLLGLLLAHMRSRPDAAAQAAAASLMRWTIFLAFWSLLPNISFSSHLGGFVTGFGLAFALPPAHFAHLGSRNRRLSVPTLTAVLGLFCVAALTTGALGARGRLSDLEQLSTMTASIAAAVNDRSPSAQTRTNLIDTVRTAEVPESARPLKERLLAVLENPSPESRQQLDEVFRDTRRLWEARAPDVPWPWHFNGR